MKKTLCFVLAIVLLFLCGCGKRENPPVTPTTEKESSTSQTQKPSVTELSPKINSSTEINEKNNTPSYPIDFKNLIIKGEADNNSLSGYKSLSKISYSLPPSKSNLSEKKICHSHGPASGGKAHHTVVDFQKTFDKYGAITLDENTEKNIYLTFDCGYEYKNLTSKILDVLKEKNVKAVFFCTLDHIKAEPELIARMIKEGHIVGNHSTTHPSFAEIERDKMVKEIEEAENYLRENFGYCAKLFRFPAGEYNEKALDTIASLGYRSIFWSVAYNDWNRDKIQGKEYAVKTVLSRLHPGAIILLHSVSEDNANAMGDIIDGARKMGYNFASLE